VRFDPSPPENLDFEGRLYRTLHALDARPFLTGEALEDACTGRDPETNRVLVHFDLALVLRAGALPAPLELLEQSTVGPSHGQDSNDKGRTAGLVGLALVVLIMIGYYGVAGVLAVLALSAYVVLVLGGLAAVGANLSPFPGWRGSSSR